jgi:GcrA cell cycle regulator
MTDHPYRWTDEELQLLRDSYAEGLTDKQVAERLGRTYEAVKKYRTKHGIPYTFVEEGRPGVWWADEDREWIRNALAEGKSVAEIARHFGRDPGTLRSRMKFWGLNYPKQEEINKEIADREQVLAGYLKDGMSYTQIGEKMGVTRLRVAGWVHRMDPELKASIAKPTKENTTKSSEEARKGAMMTPMYGGLRSRRRATPPPLEVVYRPGEPQSLKVPVLDLGPFSCRWVHGDPKVEHHCCGHTTKPGSSFCDFHHGICYTPGTEGPMLGRRIVNNAVVATPVGVRQLLR